MLYESPLMTRLSRLFVAALLCIGCGLAAVADAQPVPGQDDATPDASVPPAPTASAAPPLPDAYAPKPDDSAPAAAEPG